MATEITAEDKLAALRLNGLLDYVEELVKLDERPATRLAQHKLADGSQFILHQHELAGVPGITFDISDSDGPIWLRIERLQRISPPQVDEECCAWVDVPNDPTKPPVIRETRHLRLLEAEKDRMIGAGEARPDDCIPSVKAAKQDETPGVFFDAMLRLDDRPTIREAIEIYCAGPWAEWAEREQPRRRSIAVYQRLFEIAQRLLQSGGNESVELIWGIGVARWSRPEGSIDIPMIERGIEIEIADQANATITMRPRSVSARVELRPFEKLATERLTLAEDAARRCLRGIEVADSEGVSPFRQETFEPILKICGSQLDPEGRYLPDFLSLSATEPVPAAEGEVLTVSDRYVLFARRRSSNSVLRDIDRLKTSLSSSDGEPVILEGATRTLVMGPTDGVGDVYQPLGDKIGMSDPAGDGFEAEQIDPDHGDLFFPKPFNDDQVQIIRRLEKSDGLVVQGPPGTGKTHTIANIISHMLATGRRVLVVSHGETALNVIRDQLPEGVRDLAISVTTSEREGLKQVEKAIGLMLGIVNEVDGSHARKRNVIRELETNIVKNRKRLVEIDAQLAAIAETHLSNVPGSSEKPYKAAKRVIEEQPVYDWFTDRPDRPFSDLGIGEPTITALSEARKHVGADLSFLNERLPSPANLPGPTILLGWHRDLVAARALTNTITHSEPLVRRVIANLGLESAEKLAIGLQDFATTITELMSEPWVWSLVERQLSDSPAMQRVRPTALAFLRDVTELVKQRSAFVAKPVSVPKELPPQPHRDHILRTFAEGKNPFGLLTFRLREHQDVIEQIRVSGLRPADANDWRHVKTYVELYDKVASLSARWITLRGELSIPSGVHFSHENLSALDSIADRLQAAFVELPSTLEQLTERLTTALGSRDEALAILRHHTATAAFADELARRIASIRLSAVKEKIEELSHKFAGSDCDLATSAIQVLKTSVGDPQVDAKQLERVWIAVRGKLSRLRGLETSFLEISEICATLVQVGASRWATRLMSEPATEDSDPVIPGDWKAAWDWAARLNYLECIGAASDLTNLNNERLSIENELREDFAKLVKERTFFNLAASMKGTAKSSLRAFADLIRRLGRGTGQRAALYRRDARQAMENCYGSVPCWIMPTWRVSEQLPAALAVFDLVILDEASQSDARELPALLRGKKILVVGDDRQVSPSAAFLSIANIQRLRENFLSEFPFRVQVEPGASLYDLARVMFPDKFVMLKEHFRCVEPVIRFSSKEFYDDQLIPLRVPRGPERLDPPLVDILVEDGERRGRSKVNPPEAEVIVDEIERFISDPHLSTLGGIEARPRSIGVVSLIGSDQARYIQKRLMDRIGEAAMVRHRITCGDSATFQGDERDVVFLSMIADLKRKQSQTALQYEQRFNVALSRARDRMVLVRSVREEDLNPNDLKARIIRHFHQPMPEPADASAALIDLCQSGFERDLFSVLIGRGYRVIPQVGSEGFSIDLVVEGESGRRLAIECDGDLYHGPERWAEDMRRQRILERVGWTFWRCFGSNYSLDREGVLDDLFQTLDRMAIKPVGGTISSSRYTEHRVVKVGIDPTSVAGQDDDTRLSVGDRIVIRYLDDPRSRPEFYTLTECASDPLNGFLSISSPLAKALADASPGDEIGFRVDDRERTILYMNLERESRQAA
ncbi:AAA domain-containing protein [Methylocystis sp. SB2]|uniref:AAA domain-containing protein n=1 Tax=Methylocystis sp. (strain SB2) TaxID=743836 RepID=UPI0003FC9535|nr:AAA domain-containing protein [Methylocystis sp. SB2]ULO25111.1 AAA domain-containing protein [Methylocystis sp. SB2]